MRLAELISGKSRAITKHSADRFQRRSNSLPPTLWRRSSEPRRAGLSTDSLGYPWPPPPSCWKPARRIFSFVTFVRQSASWLRVGTVPIPHVTASARKVTRSDQLVTAPPLQDMARAPRLPTDRTASRRALWPATSVRRPAGRSSRAEPAIPLHQALTTRARRARASGRKQLPPRRPHRHRRKDQRPAALERWNRPTRRWMAGLRAASRWAWRNTKTALSTEAVLVGVSSQPAGVEASEDRQGEPQVQAQGDRRAAQALPHSHSLPDRHQAKNGPAGCPASKAFHRPTTIPGPALPCGQEAVTRPHRPASSSQKRPTPSRTNTQPCRPLPLGHPPPSRPHTPFPAS